MSTTNNTTTLRYPNCHATAQNCTFQCCHAFGLCPASYTQCYYYYDPNDFVVSLSNNLCKGMITTNKTYFKCKNLVNVNVVGSGIMWTKSTIMNVSIGAAVVFLAFLLVILMIVWYRKESKNGFLDQKYIENQQKLCENQQRLRDNQRFIENQRLAENQRIINSQNQLNMTQSHILYMRN